MTEWEILLLGAALAMDAMAVSITNGIAEPNMRPQKAVAIAFTYGAFQFGMPMLGYL